MNRPSSKLLVIYVLITMVIACCVWSFSRIDRRLLFVVDSFEVPISDLTIGKESGICFDRVPKDFLKINYLKKDSAFSWSINKKDTLLYYKINGVNPNLHKLSGIIKISYNGESYSLDSKEIEKVYSNIKSQYIKVSSLLAKQQDNKAFLGGEYKGLRSFCFRDQDDHIFLCILDRYTTLDAQDGKTYGYCYSGRTDDVSLLGQNAITRHGHCKVQFFSLSEGFYHEKKVDKDGFNYNGTNYTLKPLVITTEWGAGHVLITPTQNAHLKINFPVGITYVESISNLKDNAKISAGQITFRQNNHSFPPENNLYLPAFSNAIGSDICRLDFEHNDGACMFSADNDSIMIGQELSLSGPKISKMALGTGLSSVINARVGLLDSSYIMSYLCLPLLSLLIVLLLGSRTFVANPSLGMTLRGKLITTYHYQQQLLHMRIYFCVLAVILFLYSLCKTMIGLKLSYSYPYFEKISHILTPSLCLFMALFFLLAVVINFDAVIVLYQSGQKKNKQWLVTHRDFLALFVGALLILIGLFSLYSVDKGNAAAVIASYFPNEIWSWRLHKWTTMDGINDTHRSVVYTQVLLAVFLWFILLIRTIVYRIPQFASLKSLIVIKVNAMMEQVEYSLLRKFGVNRSLRSYSVGSFIIDEFPKLVFPIILLLGCWLIPGNFATAAISFVIIYSIGVIFSVIPYEMVRLHPVAVFCLMAGVMAILGILAVVPDNGYITNAIGFFVALLCIYFSLAQGSRNGDQLKQFNRSIRNTVIIAFALFACALLLAPRFVNTNSVDYGRTHRRMALFLKYDDLKKSGFKYAESDAEFMTVMTGYMQLGDKGIKGASRDPLSNDSRNFLHPSVSTGQSPVILNDLSIQGCFFHAYSLLAFVIYFALLLLIVYTVMWYSFGIVDQRAGGGVYILHRQMVWRIMGAFMWLGTSAYLFFSYIGWLPFTGRLNPGFGVDSVGEALESAILLGMMTATAVSVERSREDRSYFNVETSDMLDNKHIPSEDVKAQEVVEDVDPSNNTDISINI